MQENKTLAADMPRWNLSTIYRNYDDPKYTDDKEALSSAVKKLGETAGNNNLYNESYEKWLEEIIKQIDRAESLYENLYSFSYASYSVETSGSRSLKEIFTLENKKLDLIKVKKLILRKMKSDSFEIDRIKAGNKHLAEFSLFMEEAAELKKHLLSDEIEEVIEEMLQPGANSWSRMHEAITSQIEVKWDKKTGGIKTLSELRNLAFHEDRKIRKKAYKKEIKALRKAELPIAFALNGVKGFSAVTDKRRNWNSAVGKSVFQSRITDSTITALISAMEKSLPSFQKYFKAKANLLGLDKIAFYDLFAPAKTSSAVNNGWTFDKGRDFIVSTFNSFSPDMGAFAEKAFKDEWIDALPGKGKVGGAYCINFPIPGESRILCNFNNSFSSVSTIAHELGHAYHSELLKSDNSILRAYPMPLAETASIFSEILLFDTAIQQARGDERLFLTEMFLQEAAQVIVDILSRFYFEKSVFKKRKEGDLSPQEFSLLMKEAQKKTYGKAMEKESYHQYMWAVKGHYYIPDLNFYNYPYAFGELFGIALYKKYLEDKKGFPEKYKSILKMTGKKSAAGTAAFAGLDTEDENAWLKSISYIEEMIDSFEMEVAECRQRLE